MPEHVRDSVIRFDAQQPFDGPTSTAQMAFHATPSGWAFIGTSHVIRSGKLFEKRKTALASKANEMLAANAI